MSKVRLYQKKSTNDALAANYDFAFDFKDFTVFASVWKFFLWLHLLKKSIPYLEELLSHRN